MWCCEYNREENEKTKYGPPFVVVVDVVVSPVQLCC